MIKSGVFGETLAASVDGLQLGFAFLGYLIFSLFLTLGFASTNRVLFIDLIFIDLLFIGLTLSSFHIIPKFTHHLAAFSELAISIISFYGFGATVINQHYGKIVFPVGKPIVNRDK
jgi:succinate-acetate transporter protein